MKTFLERYELLKLTQKDIKYINTIITSKEIDFIIKTLLTKRSSDSDNVPT